MLKRNKLSSHKKTWRIPCILLSQRIQSEKTIYYMIPNVLEKPEMEELSVTAGVTGEGRMN